MTDENNNSGHRNSGHYNSGDYNSGNRNSGNYNSGHRNSGHYNSGHRNSGHYNSGNYNSGNYNSGHRNSGHYNSGHRNSGHYNSGDYNSGNYNSGDYNSGFFCTETPKATLFDQPTDLSWEEVSNMIPWVNLPVGCQWVPLSEMTDEEKSANANCNVIGGYLKVCDLPLTESFPLAWKEMTQKTKDRFTSLPNFDSEKFLSITGVDVRVDQKPTLDGKVVEIEGKEYRLTEVTTNQEQAHA